MIFLHKILKYKIWKLKIKYVNYFNRYNFHVANIFVLGVTSIYTRLNKVLVFKLCYFKKDFFFISIIILKNYTLSQMNACVQLKKKIQIFYKLPHQKWCNAINIIYIISTIYITSISPIYETWFLKRESFENKFSISIR